MKLTDDEIFFMRSYAANNKEEMMDLLENARHFSSDGFALAMIGSVMMKVAYLSDEEFAEIMK